MDCSNVERLMSLYIDNEIDEKTRLELENHLNSCDLCRHEFCMLLDALKVLRSIPETEIPADFKENLHEKLIKAKEEQKLERKLFFTKNSYIKAFSTVAAGALIIFAFKGMFFNGFSKKNAVNDSLNNSKMTKSVVTAGDNSSTDGENIGDVEIMSRAIPEFSQEVEMAGKVELAENTAANADESDAENIYDIQGAESCEPSDTVEIAGTDENNRKTNLPGFAVAKYGEGTPAEIKQDQNKEKSKLVKVQINVHENSDNTGSTEKVEDIIKNFQNEIIDNINKDVTENNTIIIEFNINESSYTQLIDELVDDMSELNLDIQFDGDASAKVEINSK